MARIRLSLRAEEQLLRLRLTTADIAQAIGSFDTWENDPGGSGIARVGWSLQGRRILIVFAPVGEDLLVISVEEA